MEFEKWAESKFGSIDGLSEEQVNNLKEIHRNEETLTTQTQTLTADKNQLTSDLEYQKTENKKAYEKRDKFKTERDTLQTQIEELQKSKDPNLAQQLADANKKIEELDSSIESLNTQIGEKEKKIADQQNIITTTNDAVWTELLDRLPKDSEERKFAEKTFKSDNLEALRDYIKVAGNGKDDDTDDSSHSKTFRLDDKKTYRDYSTKDLEIIRKKHPNDYVRLYKAQFGREPAGMST